MAMRTAATILNMVIRVDALILVTLGVLFWTGNAFNLIPVHMLLGILLVLSLWALAILGWRGGAPVGLALGAIVWGLVVVWLGLNQDSLVPGDLHWLIRVLHLLVGLAAIGLAEMLGARIRRAAAHTSG
ncbi:MAG TPA: hypothetical protein VGL99_18705 [Chloroflexota bacterium]